MRLRAMPPAGACGPVYAAEWASAERAGQSGRSLSLHQGEQALALRSKNLAPRNPMKDLTHFYINGEWLQPTGRKTSEVVNPATEEVFARIHLGDAGDVDDAVKACSKACKDFAATSIAERRQLLRQICNAYLQYQREIAEAITMEMGAPKMLSTRAQSASALQHFVAADEALQRLETEKDEGGFWVIREPVGVCALITPWNWPANQIACKVAAAIAAGCTMVLKASTMAPYSAHIFARILDETSLPKGVFQLIHGTGPEVGTSLASHPGINMVSFTGSKQAGISVAQNAARTVKRVVLELGGKSPNIILEGADFIEAVSHGALSCMINSGQSCNAPSRLLVPFHRIEESASIAREVIESIVVGDPNDEDTFMGPVASKSQWLKIQKFIHAGIKEGADLVTGGNGKPWGLEKGFYVKPTLFSSVANEMTIAQQEIFGPVLSIIGYRDEEHAVEIANDTLYGLSAYVFGENVEHAKNFAQRIKAGSVHLNGAGADFNAPFGGYKQSGIGREWGLAGIQEFLETKAIIKPAITGN